MVQRTSELDGIFDMISRRETENVTWNYIACSLTSLLEGIRSLGRSRRKWEPTGFIWLGIEVPREVSVTSASTYAEKFLQQRDDIEAV